MFNVDYGMYNPKCLDFQDEQQRQVACCRDFYVDRQKSVDRISILDANEVEEPLERTRLYGKSSYGRVRLQVTPLAGSGSQWIELSRLMRPPLAPQGVTRG
jgi:hypothetical protein